MRYPLIEFALCASLAAQGQIYVVDASSGPGTSYTSIQAAVLAVPDGSTLIVRAGVYTPVLIDAKGLTILCEPNVLVHMVAGNPFIPFLRVQNTQSNQTVTVRGLRGEGGGAVGVGPFRIINAAGPVTLDGAGLPLGQWGPTSTIANSSQVAIRDWTLVGGNPTCAVSNSVVVFETCTLHGADAYTTKFGGSPGGSGLGAVNSQVQLVQTTVVGGDGLDPSWPSATAAPAVTLAASSLRAMGLPSHPLTGGTAPSGQQPAVTGTGVARVDPLIPLSGPPTVTLTRPTMPSVVADSAGPGGVLTARRFGAPNLFCAMAISLRAPSSTVPWLTDPIWLDQNNFIVDVFGITPATGPFVVTKNVPNQPGLRGFQFVWQAVDFTPAGLVDLSNPSPSFVR